MATLVYPVQTTNNHLHNFESSRHSSSSYYDIDAQAIIKLEPSSPIDTDCRMSDADYSDLSSCKFNNDKQNKPLFQDLDDSLLSWTTRHPENWSFNEILDWVYFVADTHGFDGSKVRGEAYQNLSGSRLCEMTKDEFQNLDPTFGATFHTLFQQLVNVGKFSSPKLEIFDSDFACDLSSTHRHPSSQTDTRYLNPPQDSNDPDLFSVLIDGHLYDIDYDSKDNMFPEIPEIEKIRPAGFEKSEKIDHGYVSGGSEIEYEWHSVPTQNPYDWPRTDEDTQMLDLTMNSYYRPYSAPKRRIPGGSMSSEESDSMLFTEPRTHKPKTSKTGATKGNHLWEFVRDLLKDSSVNPTFLKWEDKPSGVFRFVNSEAIARLWGKKKNNKAMTYEKLSRAMRFCRTAGYFEKIPKDGKFPKKLCFKFGPKAHGWQD